MLTAYIDESGYGDKDVIVLGGFIGTDDQWDQCRQEWTAALGKRQSLHMKALRWGNTSRIKTLLDRLGSIPHHCGLMPVWASIRVFDYSDLMDDSTFGRLLQHGYFICAQYLGLKMLEYAQMQNETIMIYFEHNDHFAPLLPPVIVFYGKLFQFITTDGRPCVAGAEMIKKKDSVLTQPADYLCYARLQEMRDPHSMRSHLCSPILTSQPGLQADVTRQQIRSLMSSPTRQEINNLSRQIEPYLQLIRRKQKP